MVRNGEQRDNRFDKIVQFRSEYGIRGTRCLVEAFIRLSPMIDQNRSLLPEIEAMLAMLESGLRSIPTTGEFC